LQSLGTPSSFLSVQVMPIQAMLAASKQQNG